MVSRSSSTSINIILKLKLLYLACKRISFFFNNWRVFREKQGEVEIFRSKII